MALEIRRMVGEKSGKDKDGGQGLLAFLGSMYLLGKNFHFTRPKPAYGRQGLDWIVGQEYSLTAFWCLVAIFCVFWFFYHSRTFLKFRGFWD